MAHLDRFGDIRQFVNLSVCCALRLASSLFIVETRPLTLSHYGRAVPLSTASIRLPSKPTPTTRAAHTALTLNVLLAPTTLQAPAALEVRPCSESDSVTDCRFVCKAQAWITRVRVSEVFSLFSTMSFVLFVSQGAARVRRSDLCSPWTGTFLPRTRMRTTGCRLK